jgi:2'-5' RNA ligase
MQQAQTSLVVSAFILMLCGPGLAEQCAAAIEGGNDQVIAIDVLLEPGTAMSAKAEAANAELRKNYPDGYTLGREQVAHITVVHRYVREKDLPEIEKAVAKVAKKERPLEQQLTATGFGYSIWVGLATTVIGIDRTPELDRFAAEVVKAVEPYTVAEGTKAAFHTSRELPKIDDKIVNYVARFVPTNSGENYKPHVTIGVAHEDFVKEMKAKPFAKFTFKPAGVAIYQLGNFGTAQKKLWVWRSSEE